MSEALEPGGEVEFRQAEGSDLAAVLALFRDAVRTMEASGIYQWDELYPDEEVLKKDIEKGQMFVGTIGHGIVSVFVVNHDCDDEYRHGDWEYAESSFAVVHRLCVNPSVQNKGIGVRTMRRIEALVKGNGVETIRLDAFSGNPFALKLYDKLGYRKVGEANWRKGLFYLLEKKLEHT